MHPEMASKWIKIKKKIQLQEYSFCVNQVIINSMVEMVEI